ncbi:hypothetical protein [Halobacterium wangiae]|uniref:hypothetical protein n=1 Tax=Halobacterium wangiae TaxID=2902623 RepID=UPI001E3BF30A|nr:hypothetical protein [Halobacterium wangiae]
MTVHKGPLIGERALAGIKCISYDSLEKASPYEGLLVDSYGSTVEYVDATGMDSVDPAIPDETV